MVPLRFSLESRPRLSWRWLRDLGVPGPPKESGGSATLVLSINVHLLCSTVSLRQRNPRNDMYQKICLCCSSQYKSSWNILLKLSPSPSLTMVPISMVGERAGRATLKCLGSSAAYPRTCCTTRAPPRSREVN